MSDTVKREEYYRSKEREEQEEKELKAKQREEIIAAIQGGLPYKHLLEDCTNEITMLIEKEEEAKGSIETSKQDFHSLKKLLTDSVC